MTLIEEKYKQRLFFLRLLYGKVFEIIDAIKSGYVMFNDEILNHYYIQLTLNIDTILKEKRFKNLNKEAPQMFDSLFGDLEEIDVAGEYLKNDILQFIGKIQRECIMANVTDYTLLKEEEEFFNNIDKAINKHKENVKLHSEELIKLDISKLDGLKGRFNESKHDFCYTHDKEINNDKCTLNNEEKNKDTNKKIKYQIEHKKTREVIFNGKYLLAKPDFMSENDDFFDYIYKNPNKKLTKDEIEKEINKKLKKKLYQITSDLGFKGEFKKIFFPNISQSAIQFKNYLTDKDLKDIKVNQKKLKLQLKNLSRWKNK